jgi:uncharacterized membrane protein YfcA
VLLLAAREFDVDAFRTSIVAYFFFVDLAALAILSGQGIIGPSELAVAASLLPGALIGTAIGRRLVRRLSSTAFRNLTLALLLVTGLAGAFNAVLELIL